MDIKKGNIDDNLCRRIITDAFRSGARELAISATGEPLLNPRLEEYIILAKDLGYEYVFINTNGYLLNKNRGKSLLASGLDSIKISVNAATKETYQHIHGIDGFNRVSDNIKQLSELRGSCKLYLSFVAIKQTLNEVPILKKLFEKYVDDILVSNANARGGGDIDRRLLLGNDDFSFEYPCGQLFKTAVTTAEGYLVVCCQDFDKMTVVADLNNVSITDAWQSETFIKFRQKHLNGDFEGTICNNCLFEHNDYVIPITEELAHYPKSQAKIKNVKARIEKLMEVNADE